MERVDFASHGLCFVKMDSVLDGLFAIFATDSVLIQGVVGVPFSQRKREIMPSTRLRFVDLSPAAPLSERQR